VLASLPNHEQLIPLLLQYDVVGFQTDGDSGNFVRYLIAENQDSHREMRVFETSGHQISFTCNGRQTGSAASPSASSRGNFRYSRAETGARHWSRTW
jgi:trehalose-6-phosphate synthase